MERCFSKRLCKVEIEEKVTKLRKRLEEEGPYDIILGFSQGKGLLRGLWGKCISKFKGVETSRNWTLLWTSSSEFWVCPTMPQAASWCTTSLDTSGRKVCPFPGRWVFSSKAGTATSIMEVRNHEIKYDRTSKRLKGFNWLCFLSLLSEVRSKPIASDHPEELNDSSLQACIFVISAMMISSGKVCHIVPGTGASLYWI